MLFSKFKNHFSKRIFFLFFAAIALTIFQTVIFKSCTNQDQTEKEHKKYAVITANQDLNPGDVLDSSNTKIAYLDVSESKKSFILNSEFNGFSGSKIQIRAEKGSPILKNMIQNRESNQSLQEKIPPGKRLFVLDMDLGSMASMIQVDDKVDIIAHMDIPDFGKATETILDGISVVQIDDDHSLSFYLTPEEIKILAFMKPYSSFSVAIRNPNDHMTKESHAITFNQFLQNEKIQHILKGDSFKIVTGTGIRR